MKKTPIDILSKREEQIVQLLSEGYKPIQIQHFCEISNRTVEMHIARLKKRFEANNVVHLIAILFRKGLLQ